MSSLIDILKQLPVIRDPAVKRVLLQARQQAFNANVADLMTQLREGSIELVDWVQAMKHEIKTLHTTSAVIAKGDVSLMTQSDWGRVGAEIRKQYDYLRGFVDDLLAHQGQPWTDRFRIRALMYGAAARGSFSVSELVEMLHQGMIEYKWTLMPAEHCEDCVQNASHGWVPIDFFGSMVPGSGHTACLVNCKCHLEYRGPKG